MDLVKLSKALSKTLGKEIVITSCEKIGEGLHADGFKLTTSSKEKFFLKKNKSYELGFSLPERKFYSFMLNHRMSNKSKEGPKSIGVYLDKEQELKEIETLTDKDIFYNIQEYEDLGNNYYSQLMSRKSKEKVDEKDIQEIKNIVDFIVKLHSNKYQSNDKELLNIIYNDSLRTIIAHPELTFTFLHNFTPNNNFLTLEKQKEILSLMLDLMHKWKDRGDRLSALHGDFWGGNLFFKDGKVRVIDYSRIPWGDPGIDIGWFISQYLHFYLETNNEYFKQLGELFLNEYEKNSGDKEIRKAMLIVLATVGVAMIPSKPKDEAEIKLSKKVIEKIIGCLKAGEFSWN